MRIGEAVLETVVRTVDPTWQPSKANIARTAERMLEEAVELALACGADPDGIMMAVVDSLHNEALKVGRYPSRLRGAYDPVVIKEEICDVEIYTDVLAFFAGISNEEIKQTQNDKLMILQHRASTGELTLVKGKLYKAINNRGA